MIPVVRPAAKYVMEKYGGRGELATLDMKRRIAFLRAVDADVIEALWERNWRATVQEEGFSYDFVDQKPREIRQVRHSSQ